MATIDHNVDLADKVVKLEALVAEQQQRLENLEGRRDAPPDGGNNKDGRATRRQLLKLAGATLMGAAGSAALRAVPASAIQGSNMVVGVINTQDQGNATVLQLTGSAAPVTAFAVGAENVAGQVAIAGYGGYHGVYGASHAGGRGVYGASYSTGGVGTKGAGDIGIEGFGYAFVGTELVGLFGAGGNFGVIGQTVNGVGVKATTLRPYGTALYAYASATGAIAVNAVSGYGAGLFASGASGFVGGLFSGNIGVRAIATGKGFPGVQAAGYGGPDVDMNGTGRLSQVANITGGAGAPNFTPSANVFEMVRAGDGALFVNRGTGTMQAAWKRINAVRVDTSDGTGAAFKPLRLVDTRLGFGGPAGNGTIRDYAAAGAGSGAQHIPAGAVAVVGNLTVVAGASGGFMSIHPAGVTYNPATDPATFNFTPHSIVSNAYFCGLGTGLTNGGKLEVYVGVSGSSPANFIVDITGYIE